VRSEYAAILKGEKAGHFPRGTRINFRETLHCAKSVNPLETRFCSRRERMSVQRHGPCEVGIGKRVTSQNVTLAGFRFAMTDSGRPEQTVDDGVVVDARPACVALVPLAQPTEWTRAAHRAPSRPASTFVAQLLATADHAPQTRALRRGTEADAKTAYNALRQRADAAGIRTWQVI
jgi:hypothetical protein